jgi:hypothetical protein
VGPAVGAVAVEQIPAPNERERADRPRGIPLGRSGTRISVNPWKLVRFVILCFVVGFALSFFGFDAVDFWRGVWSVIKGAYDTLVASVGQIGSYILIGAMVVVPIWLIRALIRNLSR